MASEPEIIVDRPKGHRHTFHTRAAARVLTYPVDYGFVTGIGMNPQDGEEPDVFVGSGGPIYGRFMKGRPAPGGKGWEPDEHKWFLGLTGEEYTRLYAWWHDEHDEGLTSDWVMMTKEEAWADMKSASSSRD